jgi:hypothetical protein
MRDSDIVPTHGDGTRWKEHDSYQKSFERLMRDLRAKPQDGSDAPETR